MFNAICRCISDAPNGIPYRCEFGCYNVINITININNVICNGSIENGICIPV